MIVGLEVVGDCLHTEYYLQILTKEKVNIYIKIMLKIIIKGKYLNYTVDLLRIRYLKINQAKPIRPIKAKQQKSIKTTLKTTHFEEEKSRTLGRICENLSRTPETPKSGEVEDQMAPRAAVAAMASMASAQLGM